MMETTRKCADCGDEVTQVFVLEKERCKDCHIDARSFHVDPSFAGESYWGED